VAARIVPIRVMNLAGTDGLAVLEADFLASMLPLFQVSPDTPRAEVEVVTCAHRDRFAEFLFDGRAEVIHLSSHGLRTRVQLGDTGYATPAWLRRAARTREPIGAVVLHTSCSMASDAWVDAFLDAGAIAYIASKREVLAKDAAIFTAAFYSAYFGTTHKRKSIAQRAFDSYRLAYAVLRSHVPNTSGSNKFYFRSEKLVTGSVYLDPIRLD